jgi:hypothetical protein
VLAPADAAAAGSPSAETDNRRASARIGSFFAVEPAEAGPMLGLRLPAMGRDTNPAELRFAGCADQHGYDAELEFTALQ